MECLETGNFNKQDEKDNRQDESSVSLPVGMPGELLPQLVVLLLPERLLGQLRVPLRDDRLEVLPGVGQGLHGEPGVRVRADVETLDLLV